MSRSTFISYGDYDSTCSLVALQTFRGPLNRIGDRINEHSKSCSIFLSIAISHPFRMEETGRPIIEVQSRSRSMSNLTTDSSYHRLDHGQCAKEIPLKNFNFRGFRIKFSLDYKSMKSNARQVPKGTLKLSQTLSSNV